MDSTVSFDVPVVESPSPEQFRAIVRGHRPAVLRGLIAEWPALREWDLDTLAQRAGHRPVPVEFYPDGSWYSTWTTVTMSFRRYIEMLQSPGPAEMCYVAQVRVDEALPELVDDVPVPDVLLGVDVGAGVFLGRDSVTALHYHSRDEALLCQIGGRKRVMLYHPDDLRHLSLERATSYRFNFSKIDFGADDADDHPDAGRAVPHECVLSSGDALYIPLYWGHMTVNEDLSSSVTFFWRAEHGLWSPARLALRSRFAFWFRSTIAERVLAGVRRLFGYAS